MKEALLAIKNNEIHKLEKYIKDTPSLINEQYENIGTLLHVAALLNNNDAMDLLIKNNADVNAKNSNNLTPLHAAVIQQKLRAVETLLKVPTIDLEIKGGEDGETALHASISKGNLEIIDILVRNGANINAVNHKNNSNPLLTALVSMLVKDYNLNNDHIANEELDKDIKLIEFLLVNAANIRYNNDTPIKLLKKNLDRPTRNSRIQRLDKLFENSRTADNIYTQIINSHDEIVNSDNIEFDNITNLFIVTRLKNKFKQNNQLELIRIIAAHENNINAAEKFDIVALLNKLILERQKIASIPLIERVFNAITKDDIELFQSLIKIDPTVVNQVHPRGFSPIHIAVARNAIPFVQILIDNKVDVKAKDGNGNTALHYASLNKSLEMINLLHSKGAEIDASNNMGHTCLYSACGIDDINTVQALIDKGAKIEAKDIEGNTPFHNASFSNAHKVCQFLIPSLTNINCKNNKGFTPLHFAVENGSRDTTRILIENNANIFAKDNLEITPCQFAINKQDADILKLFENARIAEEIYNQILKKDIVFTNNRKLQLDYNSTLLILTRLKNKKSSFIKIIEDEIGKLLPDQKYDMTNLINRVISSQNTEKLADNNHISKLKRSMSFTDLVTSQKEEKGLIHSK